MNNHAKPVPVSVGRMGLRGGKKNAFTVTYSVVVILAMIGWSIGFGWVIIQLVKWLLG
jgi:hypothetical protein